MILLEEAGGRKGCELNQDRTEISQNSMLATHEEGGATYEPKAIV